ncbi:hypothetical protein NM208_g455 [Fusarium decemcellulare]|uniref:Uncharacterized protein n=1 Tax=Fusarium decemcellulare TaxID=57161 RepID=A0ACC1SZH9_9HYPO|nr:hypothetical protein NM208_g455 [Fusarium decemcellulare]
MSRSHGFDIINFGLHHSYFKFESAADGYAESLKKKLNQRHPSRRSLTSSLLGTPSNSIRLGGEQSLGRSRIDNVAIDADKKRKAIDTDEEHVDIMPSNIPRRRDSSFGNSLRSPIAIHSKFANASSVSIPTHHVNITTPKFARSKIRHVPMHECSAQKPKRLEALRVVNAHEIEKQYKCTFCGNRFKNKNEAERHQNSLHIRRFSWSCSALYGNHGAFHDSFNHPGKVDICGYCGDEFPRSGHSPVPNTISDGEAPRHATSQDWDERIRHLHSVHKFKECNQSKKFYRADHFKQHLKHSHASTSGKWTNMLEDACMVEEVPTP